MESVDTDVLGVYTVSVTVGGSTENATVYLEFPGELIIILSCCRTAFQQV